MNGQGHIDVTQLFVVMATAVFGPSMAVLIGPYILITFAAVTGAAWSLGRRVTHSKKAAWAYFIRIVFTAILLTVAVTKITNHFIPTLKEDWLIAPVALIIGLIGDDWYLVGCDASKGYFFSKDGSPKFNDADNDSDIFLGWQTFKTFAQTFYPDTEIISINPVGLKGMFKDIYQNDFDASASSR